MRFVTFLATHILLATPLICSSFSATQRSLFQKVKLEFLSSLTTGAAAVDGKIVDSLLEKLISANPYDGSSDKGYITQPPDTCWKIIWAPHIRLLESFIFWNTFITTKFTVVYKFGENGAIVTNAKYELKFLNKPFHSGNLNTKGKVLFENDSVCKIVFDQVWLDFQMDKVSV